MRLPGRVLVATSFLILIVAACSVPDGALPVPPPPPTPMAAAPPAVPSPSSPPEPAAPAVPSPPPQLDPDGNDDALAAEDLGTGALPASGRLERVGLPPLALQRICDLRPFAGSLYAAHANQPLGTDGATVTRYTPIDDVDGGHGRSPFHVAFDWNRPGEPTTGGGAGQGFLRVHAIDGRLFVPDADPPYGGFGLVDHGTEGYVFVSDREGHFAKATGEHFHPPSAPKPGPDGAAGASVLPRAYHVLDAITFRGRIYASTGAVPPTEHAWRGASPGALLVANEAMSRFTYAVDYPFPWKDGVWRLGFMVRFKDRLYAGIQDYDGREPNDYVVFAPPVGSTAITHDDVHAKRVTETGAAQTLRWYTDRGKLYWVTLSRRGEGALRVSEDGETWREIPFPEGAGRPTDVTRFRDGLVAMTERGLFRLGDDAVGTPTWIARVAEAKTPFVADDFFCAAPLAVFRNQLYVGGQRNGALYRLAE